RCLSVSSFCRITSIYFRNVAEESLSSTFSFRQFGFLLWPQLHSSFVNLFISVSIHSRNQTHSICEVLRFRGSQVPFASVHSPSAHYFRRRWPNGRDHRGPPEMLVIVEAPLAGFRCIGC